MLRNMGMADRWIRIVVGVAVLALVFIGPRSAWGYLGLIPIATAVFGYCPLYQLFGLSTNRSGSAHPGVSG